MMEQPAAKAGATLRAIRAAGKFQAVKAATAGLVPEAEAAAEVSLVGQEERAGTA